MLDGENREAKEAGILGPHAAADWAKAASWGVHLYTALGAVLGLLSLWFAAGCQVRAAFLALLLATIIDSTDGLAARALDVGRRLPHFDGALLDNVVDYLTYVAAPVFLMLRFRLLPAGTAGLAVASLVMLASAYGFCRREAKTADHYFLGFPSYWNIVALYMFCFKAGTALNALAAAVLALMVFPPLKFIYPSRATELRRLTLVLGCIWALLIVILVAVLPSPHPILVYGSFSFVIYYFAASFVLQARALLARRRAAAPASS